ncbi:mevalonate kinase [Neptuniibacter sp. QD48_11]|uniref:mevalonate kinase n=1 Tax=unclassified Neptuniibacter TaxID=2630693 RepID=UPI0039F639CF
MLKRIKVTVPGSIMLMGEHAVLFGHKALACAVDKYIRIELEPISTREVLIDSALAQYQSPLPDLVADDRLSFVLAAVAMYADRLPSGIKITIRSEFSHTVGLGSSAAVTAGVVAALASFVNDETDLDSLFDRSLAVVHDVQNGRGSGTDLVASIFGSIVSYRVKPREIKALSALPEISLYYAGYKTKTPDVLKHVEDLARYSPELYQQIYQLMGSVTDNAEKEIAKQDWQQLGQLMNNYQGLMDALGVADKAICDIVYTLRESKHITGAKISGSGLGDCVIALGSDPDLSIAYEQIPVSVSAQGVSIENN